MTSEWLEPYWHPAVYVALEELFDGCFMPLSYESPQDHDWLFKGTFERDLLHTNKNSAP